MKVQEQGDTLFINDESFSFRSNFNYEVIESFLCGPKSLILGLGARLNFAESFPESNQLFCVDLKRPKTSIPFNVKYVEANARSLDYVELSKDYDNLITHLLCEQGDALIVKELLPEFKNFDSIILGLCDKPSHYGTNCEGVWREVLSIKDELSGDYFVNLFFTRHLRDSVECFNEFSKKSVKGKLYDLMPYQLIATKHEPVIKNVVKSYAPEPEQFMPIFESNEEYFRYMQRFEHRNA